MVRIISIFFRRNMMIKPEHGNGAKFPMRFAMPGKRGDRLITCGSDCYHYDMNYYNYH